MTRHDCDETCHGCLECYRASGDSGCQQLCPHAVCQECHDPVQAGEDLCPACENDSDDMHSLPPRL